VCRQVPSHNLCPVQIEDELAWVGNQLVDEQELPRISAQSLIRSPLAPVPHERRLNTASAGTLSARVTGPATVVIW